MLAWDGCGFHKKRVGISYIKHVFLHAVGYYGSCSAFRCMRCMKCRCTIFHALVGPVRITHKVCQDTLCRTFVLHPVGYVGHVVHCGVSGA
jgi:hypothetical protein